jgi:hypothetical protein
MSRFLIGSMILVLTAASCDSATDERSVTKPRGDVQLSSKGSRLAPTPPRPDHCSRKRVRFRRREVRAVAFPRGEHPVYVGLGSPGVVHYRDGSKKHGGFYYYKTLWAVAPDYHGPVRISGYSLSRGSKLLFNTAGFPGVPEPQLYFGGDDSGSWRYGPSDTLLGRPRCYALVARGHGFAHWVTFRARP